MADKKMKVVIATIAMAFVTIMLIFFSVACKTIDKAKDDNSWIGDEITEQLEVDDTYQPDYVFDTNNPLSDKYTDREKIEVGNIKYKQYTTKGNYKLINFNINFDITMDITANHLDVGTYTIYAINTSDLTPITIKIEYWRKALIYHYKFIVKGDYEFISDEYVDSGVTTINHHFQFDFKQNNTCAFSYSRTFAGETTPIETTELLDEKSSTELGHSMTMLQENEFDAIVWDVKSTHGKLIDFDPSGNYTKKLETQKELERKYVSRSLKR